MMDHVEQLIEIARRNKSKQVIYEKGDIYYPVIRTVSILRVFLVFCFHLNPLSN
jgi:hypothetical protein